MVSPAACKQRAAGLSFRLLQFPCLARAWRRRRPRAGKRARPVPTRAADVRIPGRSSTSAYATPAARRPHARARPRPGASRRTGRARPAPSGGNRATRTVPEARKSVQICRGIPGAARLQRGRRWHLACSSQRDVIDVDRLGARARGTRDCGAGERAGIALRARARLQPDRPRRAGRRPGRGDAPPRRPPPAGVGARCSVLRPHAVQARRLRRRTRRPPLRRRCASAPCRCRRPPARARLA